MNRFQIIVDLCQRFIRPLGILKTFWFGPVLALIIAINLLISILLLNPSEAGLTVNKSYAIPGQVILMTSPTIRIEGGTLKMIAPGLDGNRNPDQADNQQKEINARSVSLPSSWVEMTKVQGIEKLLLEQSRIYIDLTEEAKKIDPQRALSLLLKKSKLKSLDLKNCQIIILQSGKAPVELLLPQGVVHWQAGADKINSMGTARYLGQEFNYDLQMFSLRTDQTDVLKDQLKLHLKSGQLEVNFNGILTEGHHPHIKGKIDLKFNKFHKFMAWLGITVPSENLLGKFTASGQFDWHPNAMQINRAEFLLGDNPATGVLSLKQENGKALIEATLAFDQLDLTSLKQMPSAEEGSDKPLMDYDLIQAFNADLRLSVKQIKLNKFEATGNALSITQKNGEIIIDIAESQMAGGSVFGHIKIDSNYPKPRWYFNISMKESALEKQYFSLLPVKWISGKTDMVWHLTGFGHSYDQILASLVGAGQINMNSGGKIDFDLGQLARIPVNKTSKGWGDYLSRKTEFDRLNARFRLYDGRLVFDQFQLIKAKQKWLARGLMSLQDERLNWQIIEKKPTAKNDATQTSKPKIKDSICYHVTGNWHSPNIKKTSYQLNSKIWAEACEHYIRPIEITGN